MLIRRVIRNKIQDQPKTALMRRLKQVIEILHGAEDGIDAAVVGDVVSKVGHGRRIDGGDPYRIDAEIDEIVEAIANAPQIADAVAVTVLKRSRIHLIDNRAFPPAQILHPNPVLHCTLPPASAMINDLWYKNAIFYCL